MNSDLSHSQRQKVTLAIKKAELLTSGEIVVVAAKQSDDYIHVPIHVACGFALAVPFIIPFLSSLFTWSVVPLKWVFLAQLLSFIVVALVFSFPPLRYWITPKSLMMKYAHRNATTQFLAVNAHSTGGRTGVLIFVSLLERYAEIIGDTAIASKVNHHFWQKIIDDMMPLLREGKISEALVLATEQSGHELAKHFPPGAENPNELPDHFIVLN